MRVSSDVVFRLGDKLIVGKNNYQTLCFNGETGEIVDIDARSLTLRMEDAQGERLVEYGREEWSQLQLAYAITSHRAQGSEWDNVVVVVSQSHYMMLQRNLLYTALTRARKRAVIVVSGGLTNKQTGRIYKSALEVAVGNDKIARRYSGLAERLNRVIAECADGSTQPGISPSGAVRRCRCPALFCRSTHASTMSWQDESRRSVRRDTAARARFACTCQCRRTLSSPDPRLAWPIRCSGA